MGTSAKCKERRECNIIYESVENEKKRKKSSETLPCSVLEPRLTFCSWQSTGGIPTTSAAFYTEGTNPGKFQNTPSTTV